MSKAQLEQFVATVAKDPAVWEKASRGEEDAQKFVRNIVEYGKGTGYEFTEDEAKAWIMAYSQQQAGGALADAQLDAVAGGGQPVTIRMPTMNWSEPTAASPQLGSYNLTIGLKQGIKF